MNNAVSTLSSRLVGSHLSGTYQVVPWLLVECRVLLEVVFLVEQWVHPG